MSKMLLLNSNETKFLKLRRLRTIRKNTLFGTLCFLFLFMNGINSNGQCNADGGTLTGGPFTFNMVGDGTPDMIQAGSITLANNQGANSQWVVTDGQGYILGLPPMPGVVDFDGAGAGTCLVWHLSYDGMITGAAPGLNANDIQGCFDLSNPIEVIRENASVDVKQMEETYLADHSHLHQEMEHRI